jgi:hypothetical protein
MPRVKLIHVGNDEWVAPKEDYRTCKHPREWRRFDPRYSLPVAQYCCLCGKGYIHPFFGFSEKEIEEAYRKADELRKKLGLDDRPQR